MSDVCPKCGKEHPQPERTGKFAGEAALDDLRLVINALSNTMQAMDPRNIPDGIPQEKMQSWLKSLINLKAAYQLLEQNWWKEAVRANGFPPGTRLTVDFDNGELLKF